MFVRYDDTPDLPPRKSKYIYGGDRKKALREWLWFRQDKKCFWCGQLTVLPITKADKRSGKRATFDHLIPRCRGGWLVLHNLVVACDCCNRHRSTKTPQKTIKWLSSLLSQ